MPETTLVLTVSEGVGGGGPCRYGLATLVHILSVGRKGGGKGPLSLVKSKLRRFFPSNYLSPG